MKFLSSLLQLFQQKSDLQVEINAITQDSRAVKPGSLFCAVKGHALDGHDFIQDALTRGASAVFCERALEHLQHPEQVFVIPELYSLLGELADFFYEQPSQHLKVVGVTGTNGKTSTTHYIAQLLHLLGESAAVIGTVGNGLWGALTEGERTTPDVFSLHRLLQSFVKAGAKWALMEVSSHALDQNRVDAVRFYGAIFTNLTQDHLDYHLTMDAYGAAKAKLFQRPELKIAVLNREDPFAETILKTTPLRCKCLFYDPAPNTLKTQLLGDFNLSNLGAALTFLVACGFSPQELEMRAALLNPVKGRMEGIRYPGKPLVVIDYAHTPDALKKALSSLKAYQRRLWIIFGCGGNRDPGKRPLMAGIAESLADRVIVTEDNSRFETIEMIFADIRAGFRHPEEIHFIPNRTTAIEFALEHATADEIILLAGKGHETYMEQRGAKTDYDERKVIADVISREKQFAIQSEFILGVVGKNIGYSKSPFIQNEFAKAQKLAVTYTIEEVNEGTFDAKISDMQKRGFVGCNITVPYKEEAFLMAHEKSARAEKAGAANTFLFKGEHIYADNTDGIGLIRDLTQNLAYAIKDKRILICGAGGAVRGILAPLLDSLPVSITLANRTPEKGAALAKTFSTDRLKIKATTYADLAHNAFDLVIDGTSLKTECLPLRDSVRLSEDSLVYDLKYNLESETNIMRWGKAHGARVYDGIGMLVEQAAEAFKIWTGREPATEPVIRLMKEKSPL